MKKNALKFVLDAIMSILFVFMFKKNVLTLQFHEIGGIIVCLLFLLHVAINKNWILAASKTAFKKGAPAKIRISYVLDFLLLANTSAVLFTGIGINKVTAPKIAFLPNKAIPLHLFFGAVFMILICVHIGLHWNWIKNTICKNRKKPMPKPAAITLTLVLCALTAAGAVNLCKSDTGRQLSAVFSSAPANEHGARGEGKRNFAQNDLNPHERNLNPQEKTKTNRQNGRKSGERRRKFGKNFNRPKITFKSTATYLFQWITILIFISTLTALTEKSLKKIRRKQSDDATEKPATQTKRF